MATLPVGYIHRAKCHRQKAVGHWISLFVKCCRMVDSVPRWQLSLSWPIQLDHPLIADQMMLPSGQEHSHGKIQYIPGKQVLVRFRFFYSVAGMFLPPHPLEFYFIYLKNLQ